MRTLILQHTLEEKPGTLVDWLGSRSHSYTLYHVYENRILPNAENFDALVVLGGPMNVDEESAYPWLKDEKKFLEAWLQRKRHTLGICLGGQMLAQVLGGRVEKNKVREIGFHSIQKIPNAHPAFQSWPEKAQVFQWHEDRFVLPSSCKPLHTSEACEHQSFALDAKTVGLQFHPESTEEWILSNYQGFTPVPGERYVQSLAECKAVLPTDLPKMRDQFFGFLDAFFR